VKAGGGMAQLPAWEDESAVHYLWRVCQRFRYAAGPEPPVGDAFAPFWGAHVCEDRVGRWRANHELDRDGCCIWCGVEA
jgi:hypothetical protein